MVNLRMSYTFCFGIEKNFRLYNNLKDLSELILSSNLAQLASWQAGRRR